MIADAVPGRNANMTVRNVGGSVIDLTVRNQQSDQFSAYYPLNALYALVGPVRPTARCKRRSGRQKDARLPFAARRPTNRRPKSFTLPDGARWLKIITRVTNIQRAARAEPGRRHPRRRRVRFRPGRRPGAVLGYDRFGVKPTAP